jgi:hypothetical protein
MRAEQRTKVEIAGIVDQDGVARTQQQATYQVDRLRARIRQHDLVGRRRDALFCEPAEQQAAQGE